MNLFGYGGFGYGGFGVMFFLTSTLVLGIFIFVFVKLITQWNRNNNSPRLTVPARIVAKRTNVSHHHHGTNHMSTHSTSYYVTFQVESGDRMELHVNGTEFGMVVEGDEGKLTFQGTRYLGFERLR